MLRQLRVIQGPTMPSIRQGDIHDHEFGPDNGAELSGRRPALIISTDEFNGNYGTAIALPMSSTMPAERYRTRQHVYISDTDSWVSTRQVKAVHQRRLGVVTGRASPDELDDTIESLVLNQAWNGMDRGDAIWIGHLEC